MKLCIIEESNTFRNVSKLLEFEMKLGSKCSCLRENYGLFSKANLNTGNTTSREGKVFLQIGYDRHR
jgi:hypothetical protein